MKKILKTILNWLKTNLKDTKNYIIFAIVFLLLSSEVWVCYILGFVFKSAKLIALASVFWAFWLGPFTPFLPLCVALTVLIRKILGKLFWNENKNKNLKMDLNNNFKSEKKSNKQNKEKTNLNDCNKTSNENNEETNLNDDI